jgi:hypothetical protein
MVNTFMKIHDILNESQYDHLEPDQQDQHIEGERVLSLDMTPYELTKLMREFRSGVDSYGKVEDKAMVAFYSDEERREFEAYLNRKGVVYKSVGGDN